MSQTVVPTRRAEFWAGAKDTIPLMVGGAPFGFIFGAVAVTGGISPLGTLAMSLFVFAGSAQFIGAGLVKAGVSGPLIVLTTFIVNLRHALYAATLAPHMKHLSQRWLAPLGFWLTDESFVIAAARYDKPDRSPHKHWYLFGSAIFMYLDWQLWTLIGLVAGQSIPRERVEALGLGFAAIVTFIGILVPLIRSRSALAAVVAAGIAAVLFNGLPNKLGLIIAALTGVAVGVLVEARINPVSEASEAMQIPAQERVTANE